MQELKREKNRDQETIEWSVQLPYGKDMHRLREEVLTSIKRADMPSVTVYRGASSIGRTANDSHEDGAREIVQRWCAEQIEAERRMRALKSPLPMPQRRKQEV